MKVIFDNLQKEAIKAAGLEADSRWKRWVKFVDRVDTSQSDGFAFVGDFINEGTIEVDLPTSRLALVCTTTGSNKYRTSHYQVVWVNPDKSITPVDGLSTNDSKRGWALRLRDKVAALLDQTPDDNPLASFSTAELQAELERRMANDS
jgi:hypothetical protein